ncbi:MAG TPA: general stress protein [Gemmatimonadales bacterium]|jgi:hypothetical protein|nr:general stress protein [Gemmatimonadales bacterium]
MPAYDSTGTTTGRTIVGLFPDRADAEAAIQDLKDAGFTNEQIGVAMRDAGEQQTLAADTGANAATGAATGAVSGGLVGGLIGLLGSLLIPGVGPIVVGGVLASTLVGAGAGAATGGIIGGLIGMGVSEEDARHFDARFREGAVLVTVTAGARTDEAIRILDQHGADMGPSRMTSGVAGAARLDRTDYSRPDLATGTGPDVAAANASVGGIGYRGVERRSGRDRRGSSSERAGTL